MLSFYVFNLLIPGDPDEVSLRRCNRSGARNGGDLALSISFSRAIHSLGGGVALFHIHSPTSRHCCPQGLFVRRRRVSVAFCTSLPGAASFARRAR